MRKYYLKINVDASKNASSKAVNDCNYIMEMEGYNPFELNLIKGGNGVRKKFHNTLQFAKLFQIPQNSVVVVSHPIYVNKKYLNFLERAKKKRKLRLVFLIHDLESVRKMFPDALEHFEWMDQKMYAIADKIIAHNDKMRDYLVKHGVASEKIVVLEVFDYLADECKESPRYEETLNIAGNLDANKSKYLAGLNELNRDININMYGANYSNDNFSSDSVHYQGSFTPDEIPHQLNRGFGLVWDGTSILECAGNTGEYLKINNPHKLSLYIISGLPVVIWSQAAEAKFVENNGLGLVVDNIDEFDNAFKKLSQEQYNEIAKNVSACAQKLREGYYLKKALKEID